MTLLPAAQEVARLGKPGTRSIDTQTMTHFPLWRCGIACHGDATSRSLAARPAPRAPLPPHSRHALADALGPIGDFSRASSPRELARLAERATAAISRAHSDRCAPRSRPPHPTPHRPLHCPPSRALVDANRAQRLNWPGIAPSVVSAMTRRAANARARAWSANLPEGGSVPASLINSPSPVAVLTSRAIGTVVLGPSSSSSRRTWAS
jgi:hypothetical protein